MFRHSRTFTAYYSAESNPSQFLISRMGAGIRKWDRNEWDTENRNANGDAWLWRKAAGLWGDTNKGWGVEFCDYCQSCLAVWKPVCGWVHTLNGNDSLWGGQHEVRQWCVCSYTSTLCFPTVCDGLWVYISRFTFGDTVQSSSTPGFNDTLNLPNGFTLPSFEARWSFWQVISFLWKL